MDALDTACLDANICRNLANSIEKICTSGQQKPDPTLMKTIKKICRTSDNYIKHTYDLIMHHLEKEHAEVRLNSFAILDDLFRRSHVFREIVLSDFQNMLELTLEIDPDYPLPPPKSGAEKLKRQTLLCIQSWHSTYGPAYKPLRLGYNFLKDCKKMDFNDIEARSLVERIRLEEENRKREEMMKKKVDGALQEIQEKQSDLESVLTEVENAYCLILQTTGNIFTASDFIETTDLSAGTSCENLKDDSNGNVNTSSQDDQTEAFPDDKLRQHGLGNFKYNITVEIEKKNIMLNEDNAVIVSNLRELIYQIHNAHLPMVEKWIQILTKAGGPKDALLKSVDIKQALIDAREKFQQLKIESMLKCGNAKDDNDVSDDDDFVEVEEKEGFEENVKSTPLMPAIPGSSSQSKKSYRSRSQDHLDPTSKQSNILAWMARLEKKW